MFDTARLLVLWIPDWPVLAHTPADRGGAGASAAPAGESAADSAPIAVIDRGIVFACSPAARAEGVRRGMRQREAQACCPGIRVVRYDAALDARAFEPVITALERVLPGVHPIRPGAVAVRARGAARYYGGERAAALTVRAVAEEAGARGARVGIADGLFAAERAARAIGAPDASRITGGAVGAGVSGGAGIAIVPPGGQADFLAPLPIGLLGDPELAALLPRLGVRTLGDFAALAAEDVTARFGPTGARLHALAGGRDARPATPRIPPRDLDAVVHLEPALDRVDQIAFAVRQAADDLVARLLAQKLVCTALRVELDGEEGETSERVWLHPRSFTPAEVVDRVRWQLAGSTRRRAGTAGARDEVPMLRSAVARVRLSPDAVDAAGAHERGLWGTGPDEGVHSALSRVQGMLGHEGVLTAVPSGGRSPAERQSLVPWGDRPRPPRDPGRPWPGALPPPAPATVYEVPRQVAVEDARGRVVAVDARGAMSAPPAALVSPAGARRRLTAWAGPWPLAERWWDARAAREVSRFQAVDAEGMAWLLVLDDRGWWAEGRYD